jgi:hypothetical protein
MIKTKCNHPNFYDDGRGKIICRTCREIIERYAPL